jgi:hypothetical protein
MRRFDISARQSDAGAMRSFAELESLLKNRLEKHGQEGERVLRGTRDTTSGAEGDLRRIRTFYSDISPEAALAIKKEMESQIAKRDIPAGSVSASSGEAFFAQEASVLNDTAKLKEFTEFIKKNGGEFSFEKGRGNTGTLNWGLPSDLMVEGARGGQVSAVKSLRSMIAAENDKKTKKYQDLIFGLTGRKVSKQEIKAMSQAAKADIERSSETVEKLRASGSVKGTKEAVLKQKLDSKAEDFQVKRSSGLSQEEYELALRRTLDQREFNRQNAERIAESDPARWPGENKALEEKRAKAKEAKARRTPGTEEFARAEAEKHDSAKARRAERIKWAKANKNDPYAKAILRQDRKSRASRVGQGVKGLLRNAGSMARATALTIITASLAAAVKFLSSLPGVASDVRHISAKGAALDMTNPAMRGLRHLEQVAKMSPGSIAETLGAIVASMPDLATGGSAMPEIVHKIAAISQRDPHSKALEKTINFGVGGGNPAELYREYMNTIFRLAYQESGALGNKADFGESFRNAATVFDKYAAPNILNQSSAILETISDDQWRLLRGVANGSVVEINGESIEKYDVYGAIEKLLGVDDSKYSTQNTATVVEWKGAEEVSKTWKDLATTASEIKEGILVQILGATEGLAVWLRDILKTIMLLPIFGGKFDAVVASMDEEDYKKNLEARKSVVAQLAVSEMVIPSLAKAAGVTDSEKQKEALDRWLKGSGPPPEIQEAGLSGVYQRLMYELFLQKYQQDKLSMIDFQINSFENKGSLFVNPITRKKEGYTNGSTSAPFGYRTEQAVMAASNAVSGAYRVYAQEVDKIYANALEWQDSPDRQSELEHERAELERWIKLAEDIRKDIASFPPGREKGGYEGDGSFESSLKIVEARIVEQEAKVRAMENIDPQEVVEAYLQDMKSRLEYAQKDYDSFGGFGVRVIFNPWRGNIPAPETQEEAKMMLEKAKSDYDRAEAAAFALGLMQARSEEGGEKPYVGSLGVENDIARRTWQDERVNFEQVMLAIGEDFGSAIQRQVLDGKITVGGVIKADEQSVTITLKDERTGKTVSTTALVYPSQDIKVSDLIERFNDQYLPVE